LRVSCKLPICDSFDIKNDMIKNRYRVPSTSALQAFEAAARHCNFSRAAEELHTSQSAISRHIASLEARLDTSLFDRQRKKRLILTHIGPLFSQPGHRERGIVEIGRVYDGEIIFGEELMTVDLW